jgi:hypothetical protein
MVVRKIKLYHIDINPKPPTPVEKLTIKVKDKEYIDINSSNKIYDEIKCIIRDYPGEYDTVSSFNVLFSFVNGSQYWSKLNKIQLFKLRWMYGVHWLQKDNGYGNLRWVIGLVCSFLFGLVTPTIITWIVKHLK